MNIYLFVFNFFNYIIQLDNLFSNNFLYFFNDFKFVIYVIIIILGMILII